MQEPNNSNEAMKHNVSWVNYYKTDVAEKLLQLKFEAKKQIIKNLLKINIEITRRNKCGTILSLESFFFFFKKVSFMK